MFLPSNNYADVTEASHNRNIHSPAWRPRYAVKQTILVADDEADVLSLISSSLIGAGFEVCRALDGSEALLKARSDRPALIVLDVMMPNLSGLEVCKQLKRENATQHIPIILLTAKAGEIDRVLGFELGADDYVTKPFSPRELVLRVQSILRRSAPAPNNNSVLRVGEIILDRERHRVSIGSQPVDLTAIEFRLLQVLMENLGKVQSRSQLLAQIWGYDRSVETRTVDTHMRRLRDKLGPAADHIHTVRSFGYRLDPEPRAMNGGALHP